jgi:hypothetical protein
MSKFAKLYERDGKQVLVLKGENEDGGPALEFRFLTDVAEHSVALNVTIRHTEDRDAYEALDLAFDEMTEDRAFNTRDKTPGVEL